MSKEIPNWRLLPWKLNLYICPKCNMGFTTVDIHEGTTPATLSCVNRKSRCLGRAVTQGYPHERPVAQHVPEPIYEFYKPTDEELVMLKFQNPSVHEHCTRGGLAIRDRDVGNDPATLNYLHHRVGKKQTAVDVILEIIKEDDNFMHEELKVGFYHFDEKEANVCGPYDSLDAAIKARNEYFKQL